MEETLENLEKKREHLYQQMREVGDFRRGIQAMGRCIYGTQPSKAGVTPRL